MAKFSLQRVGVVLLTLLSSFLVFQLAYSWNSQIIEENSSAHCNTQGEGTPQNLIPECTNDGQVHDYYYTLVSSFNGRFWAEGHPANATHYGTSINYEIISPMLWTGAQVTYATPDNGETNVSTREYSSSPSKFTGTYDEFKDFLANNRFRWGHSGTAWVIDEIGMPKEHTIRDGRPFVDIYNDYQGWVISAVFEDGYDCNPTWDEGCNNDDGGDDSDDGDDDGIADSDNDGINDDEDRCPNDPTNTCDCPTPTIKVRGQ